MTAQHRNDEDLTPDAQDPNEPWLGDEVIDDEDEDGPPNSSPLNYSRGYDGSLRWAGPIDNSQRAAIAARVDYGAMPWWRRVITPIPDGFRPVPWPLMVLKLQRHRTATPPLRKENAMPGHAGEDLDIRTEEGGR